VQRSSLPSSIDFNQAPFTALKDAKPTFWLNPKVKGFQEAELTLGMENMLDSARRLVRFAPLLAHVFPEIESTGGIIESPLEAVPDMQDALCGIARETRCGDLFLKCDHLLPISGSIKARGGIYEVLYHAEQLALAKGLIDPERDYTQLADGPMRAFFAQHQIVVGSTGNLGLSIGIMGAALGFEVVVHMSVDARAWKKALLREKGVTVVEHTLDYSVAVAEGRKQAEQNPNAYFIDDEDSQTLFLGYSVAALRLKDQISREGIRVDAEHPLIVYLPCGVGGAPGGITFGLKQVFGDDVHCYFIEPTQSPCMLLGMASGEHNRVSVQEIGLTNHTCADGLAVGRASAFVGPMMDALLSGISTVDDSTLYRYLKLLFDRENERVEPSAAAGFKGYLDVIQSNRELAENATHIVWSTGGSMVPEDEWQRYYTAEL
jgi:D-serine dehydratase